jgi:LysR family transcriptional regulator, regulator for metE and metH
MGQIEIKHLKMIRSIAETGNLTKSAESLFVTQSALSQQLKDIEAKLNVDLFARTRKKMILTATGKKLLTTAEKIIDTLEETELEIARIVSGDAGEFRVGTHCIFCYKWLPSVLSSFQQKFPNVTFELGTSTALVKDLEDKRFDVVIAAMPIESDSVDYTPLFSDRLMCIMSPDDPARAKPFVSLEDFKDICLITHAEKMNNGFYQRLLKPKGIEPARMMIISQPQAIQEMVAAGFGKAVVPGWAIQDAVESGQVVALPITRRGGIPITWGALSLKKGTAPVFQNEFIRMATRMNPAGRLETKS